LSIFKVFKVKLTVKLVRVYCVHLIQFTFA